MREMWQLSHHNSKNGICFLSALQPSQPHLRTVFLVFKLCQQPVIHGCLVLNLNSYRDMEMTYLIMQ